MQTLNAVHQCLRFAADRLGLVVDATANDRQQLGLPRNKQLVCAVDHRLSLSNPPLGERSF